MSAAVRVVLRIRTGATTICLPLHRDVIVTVHQFDASVSVTNYQMSTATFHRGYGFTPLMPSVEWAHFAYARERRE
jgi:hypothetical protein